MAAIIYGSTRTAVDVDIVILVELDELEKVFKIFSNRYTSLQPKPLSFFRRCFFVPLQNAKTKIRVDIAAALSGFERKVLARSHRRLFDKIEESVCAIEDLLLMKLVAARAKEFIEVERGDVPERMEKLLRKFR